MPPVMWDASRSARRRVAGSRRPEPVVVDPYADAALVVAIVGDPKAGGYQVQVDNRIGMPTEEAAALIEQAVDRLTGRNDRTRGLF